MVLSVNQPADVAEREAGAAVSFEAFFDERYEPLLRALYLIARDRHEAEDLAQEAFVRVYERWDRVRRTDNPGGYLYRTALNAHRSRLRRLVTAAKRTISREDPDLIAASDDRDEIRRLLAELPDGQRQALVLVEWVGMTDVEAAEVLKVTPVAVRVRLSRARQAIKERKRADNA
jgi:RNA polymerase sigma-70 factor (ECF subfamily)